MKTILLFGSGPLPEDVRSICSASGLRTQQFFEPLQSSHRVKLFLIGNNSSQTEWKNKRLFEISRQNPQLFSLARKVLQAVQPDIVVGVNTFPAFVAARSLNAETPFWADLNGWIMAEMQAQSYELQHDHYLMRGWEQEKGILLRADQISTVSAPQKFAVVGELAALGRLNREHFSPEFVHVIPNATEVFGFNETNNGNTVEKNTVWRKKRKIPQDAFIIAQIGGLNNWVDEATLFAGLEKAMAENSDIHFVSTGGAIPDIAPNVFERFRKKVVASSLRERFHLLGWVEAEEIPQILAAADLGLMVDRLCVETQTGARNRVNEMMKFGLPILMTRGSEISADIARSKCGKVVESGDVQALYTAIITLQKDQGLRLEFSKRAREMCQEFLTNTKTLEPLQKWLAQERQHLLHQYRVSLEGNQLRSKMRAGVQFLKERGVKNFWRKVWQRRDM